jgi:NAD dependent epimerase/dehydratase
MASNQDKVLVTGAGGFIGSHLVESLIQSGFSVRALCHYNSSNNFGCLEGSPYFKEIEIVTGDVRDPFQMLNICSGVQTVYHLAALIGIPYSYRSPSSYIETNIVGTENILQASLRSGVNRIIQTSTSEVYGTAQVVPIKEDHPLQAQSPYSATKIGADALAYSFYSSFNLPVVIARPFNTYGPRQSARAVIPTVITQMLAGRTTIKLGALTPTRDFNFVLDTCQGFIALAECDAAIGKTVNIGSGTEISIGDTVALIAELIGVDVQIECDELRLRPVNSEVERLICDNSLMRLLTGHSPRHSLREGLAQTIGWLRQTKNLNRYKLDQFNV